MTTYDVDQGADFGTWVDPVSRFMYEGSLTAILPLVGLQGHVGDFGGANGLLKRWHSYTTTIDIDPSKEPDILDDILTHRGRYDVAWCRYVIHYLTDSEVIQFVNNVNAPRLIVVQFVNEDLRSKYANSMHESKYFRTASQLEALLPAHAVKLYTREYEVTAEFYKNRLGLNDATPHTETLNVYEIARGF